MVFVYNIAAMTCCIVAVSLAENLATGEICKLPCQPTQLIADLGQVKTKDTISEFLQYSFLIFMLKQD